MRDKVGTCRTKCLQVHMSASLPGHRHRTCHSAAALEPGYDPDCQTEWLSADADGHTECKHPMTSTPQSTCVKCIPMHFGAFQCISVHSNAFWCIPMHFCAFQCIPLHFNAFHCISVHSNAFQCIPMHFSALRSLTQPLLDCIL